MKNLDLLVPQKQVETNRYLWATVTSVSPLRVRLDGEDAALDITPDCLLKRVEVNDRVWCQFHGRRLVILGASGGEPDAPPYVLPTRLGEYAHSLSDWNNAITNGWYMASGAANAPVTGWLMGMTICHNSSWVYQRVTNFTATTPTWWSRYLKNGVWSPWVTEEKATAYWWRATDVSVAHATWSSIPYPSGSNAGGITGSTSFTVPRTGRYLITGQVVWVSNPNGRRLMRVLLNGSTVIYQVENVVNGASLTHLPYSFMRVLNAGDYITIQGYQSAGGPIAIAGNADGAYTFISIDEQK